MTYYNDFKDRKSRKFKRVYAIESFTRAWSVPLPLPRVVVKLTSCNNHPICGPYTLSSPIASWVE